MNPAHQHLRVGALALAALVGFVGGLLVGRSGPAHPGGSRIAWPAPETLHRHAPSPP